VTPGSSHARPGQANLLGTPPSNLISPPRRALSSSLLWFFDLPSHHTKKPVLRPRVPIASPIIPRGRLLEGTFWSPLDHRIPIYFGFVFTLQAAASLTFRHLPADLSSFPPNSQPQLSILSSSSSIEENKLDGKHSPSRRRTIAQTSPSARELYTHRRVLYAYALNVRFCLSDPKILFHLKGQVGERLIDESALYIKSWSNCFIFRCTILDSDASTFRIPFLTRIGL
jgi:hypothetical protein